MSEPVTNSEIEDVLSSIRRLISENPAKGENGDSEGGSSDKLVLTPAFRVLEGDAEADAGPRGESVAGEVARDVQEAPGEGSAEAGPAEEPAEASGEDSAESHDRPADETPEASAGERAEAAVEETTQAADESDENNDLEQRIAELEAVIGENTGQWQPDDSEYEEDAEAPSALHVPEAPAEWDVVADQPEYADAFAEAGSGEMPDAGVILEAEEIRDEAEESEEAGEGEEAEESEEDILLDEEALREMVAQLVREQLKGQIGERITRSIRRMVRREIRLALAVRDTE